MWLLRVARKCYIKKGPIKCNPLAIKSTVFHLWTIQLSFIIESIKTHQGTRAQFWLYSINGEPQAHRDKCFLNRVNCDALFAPPITLMPDEMKLKQSKSGMVTQTCSHDTYKVEAGISGFSSYLRWEWWTGYDIRPRVLRMTVIGSGQCPEYSQQLQNFRAITPAGVSWVSTHRFSNLENVSCPKKPR